MYLSLISDLEIGPQRFFSESFEDAVEQLRALFPVGQQVEEKLRRGERISTENYSLQIVRMTEKPPKQKSLPFD